MNKDSCNIRAYALDIITEVLDKGAYADKALHSVLDSGVIPDNRDRAFLSRLCTGTVERLLTLDYILTVLQALRLIK